MVARTDTTLVIDGVSVNIARDKNGVQLWSWDPLPDSRATRNEIDAQFGQIPPEVTIPKVFRSGHSGYGYSLVRGPDTYHYAVNGDASHPDQFIRSPQINRINLQNLSPGPGPSGGSIVGFFEQGGFLFVLAGQYCLKVTTAATPVVTIDRDFGNGITATRQPAVWLGIAYVGIGAGGPFWRRVANGTWSQQNSGTIDASTVYSYGFMAMTDALWRIGGTTTIVSVCAARSEAMTAANWSSGINVGDDQAVITSLVSLGEVIFVGKTDGLYNADTTGRALNVLPQIGGLLDSRNCQHVAVYGTDLLVPHVRGAIQYSVPTGDYYEIQPGYLTSNESSARGQVTAFVVDGFWAYAAVMNHAGESWIFKGHVRTEGDQGISGHFVWHPWLYLGVTTVDALWVSGLWTNPRLFFGMTTTPNYELGYVVLPRDADTNPLYDSNTTMATQGVFYFSATDFGSPGTYKVVDYIDVLADHLSDNDYVDIEISPDQGAWVRIGRVTTDGTATLYPTTVISGERFNVRMTMASGSAVAGNAGGVVRKVVLHATERPPVIGVFQATVLLANDSLRKDGQPHILGMAGFLSHITGLAVSRQPIVINDPLRRSLYGFILGKTPYQETAQQKERDSEIALTFRFVVRSILGSVGRYGQGRYGYSTYGVVNQTAGEYGSHHYGNSRYG